MPRARPASDLADLLARPAGERLLLPSLMVVGKAVREITYQGVEQSVYDYRFKVVGDTSTWEVEYSGQYHHGWERGRQVLMIATVHRVSRRWRCIRVKRPVIQERGTVPLFGIGA